MAKRPDVAETVETATHHLHYEQAHGWVLESLGHAVEYAEVNGLKVIVRKTVTVTLVPGRG